MPPMGNFAGASARLHKLGVIFAAVVFSAALAIALTTGSANAAPQVTVLGAAAPAQPSCPANCQAIGKATGMQVSIGKTKSPFVVPHPGRMVAWSIKLSSPTAKQSEFFNDFFGGLPAARISVLKPIMKKIKQGKPIYRIKSQSPVESLSSYLGSTTTFTLQKPLRVKRNNIVALTVPTWAPAFAVGQGNKSVWMASRKRGKCNKAADIRAGRAAEVVGANRAFGCVYKTARILYSATIVKDPKAPPSKKKKGT